jgi:signal transduction histidine kinase
VDNENTQKIEGFGIGLYLSAAIIKQHDGNIWAESEFGDGATFYFSLSLPEKLNK